VLFAAATGLRPGDWIALEHRDIDTDARVLYVRRAFTDGRLKCTKTPRSVRAVPLQATELDALSQISRQAGTTLVFPAKGGGYSTCTTSVPANDDPPRRPPAST